MKDNYVNDTDDKSIFYRVPPSKSLKDRLDNLSVNQQNVLLTVMAIILLGAMAVAYLLM